MRLTCIAAAAAAILLSSIIPASPEPACQSTKSITICKSRPGCAWVITKNKGKNAGKCVPVKVTPR